MLYRWLENVPDDEVLNWSKLFMIFHVIVVVYGNVKVDYFIN